MKRVTKMSQTFDENSSTLTDEFALVSLSMQTNNRLNSQIDIHNQTRQTISYESIGNFLNACVILYFVVAYCRFDVIAVMRMYGFAVQWYQMCVCVSHCRFHWINSISGTLNIVSVTDEATWARPHNAFDAQYLRWWHGLQQQQNNNVQLFYVPMDLMIAKRWFAIDWYGACTVHTSESGHICRKMSNIDR